MSDRATWYARILQWADEAARRSGSVYVDERQQWIRDAVAALQALPPDYHERRSGQERRSADALDGGNMGRRVTVRRGPGGAVGGTVYQDIDSIAIGNTPATFLAGGGATHLLRADITWTSTGIARPPTSITWSSSNASVLAVDSVTGILTTGSPGGDTTVTITLTVERHTATADIVVSPLPASGVSSVTILPPVGQTTPYNLSSGQTMDFDVAVRNEYGVIDPALTVTWSSSATGVATVNSSGVVSYVANGTATITATSDTDGTKSDSVVVNGVSAAASVVEMTPGLPFSAANGSTINFSAVVKDASGNILSGRTLSWSSSASGTVSINSSSGVATVAGTSGTATITVTDTISSLTDTVVVTATAAPGAGQAESPTGGRPQYAWTLEKQYLWNQMYADYVANPASTARHVRMIAEYVRLANLATVSYGDWPSLGTAWLMQVTGSPTYRDLAWTKWYNTATTINWTDGDNLRERSFMMVVMYDWMYPMLNTTQRQQGADALYTIGDNARLSGGNADTDTTIGRYPTLVALHYLDVPENAWYQTILTTTSSSGRPNGGLFDTTLNHNYNTSRRSAFWSEITRAAAGGWWFEGAQYNDGTSFLAMQGFMLRTSGVNGSSRGTEYDLSAALPELDAWIDEHVAVAPYILTPDLLQEDEWADDQDPRQFNRPGHWLNFIAASNLGSNAGNCQLLRRLANDLFDANVSTIVNNGRAVHRALWFWDPYATATVGALPWDAAYSAALFADPAKPIGGLGHLNIKGPGNLLVQLHGCREHYTDHTWDAWNNVGMYWDGNWVLTRPVGYVDNMRRQHHQNGLMLAGQDAMQENVTLPTPVPGWGYARTSTGTAGGLPWHCMVTETYGRPKVAGGAYPANAFITMARRRMLFLPEVATGYHAFVIHDYIEGTHPLVDQMVSLTSLIRSGAHNVTVAAACTYLDDQTFPLRSIPTGTLWTPPTGVTIPAGKWGAMLLSIAKGSGAITPTVTWAATTNHDTEAAAIAVLPSLPVGHQRVGHVAVQAPAGSAWVSGTNALQNGGGTNPSPDTNYYLYTPYTWFNYDSRSETTPPFTANTMKELAYDSFLRNGLCVGEQTWWAPVAPTITNPDYSNWTATGGKAVRVYHLAPTASTSPAATITRVVVPGSKWISPGSSERTLHQCLIVGCTSAASPMTYTSVVLIGSGTLPAAPTLQANNPNVVNVGSRQVTFNSTSETVT